MDYQTHQDRNPGGNSGEDDEYREIFPESTEEERLHRSARSLRGRNRYGSEESGSDATSGDLDELCF